MKSGIHYALWIVIFILALCVCLSASWIWYIRCHVSVPCSFESSNNTPNLSGNYEQTNKSKKYVCVLLCNSTTGLRTSIVSLQYQSYPPSKIVVYATDLDSGTKSSINKVVAKLAREDSPVVFVETKDELISHTNATHVVVSQSKFVYGEWWINVLWDNCKNFNMENNIVVGCAGESFRFVTRNGQQSDMLYSNKQTASRPVRILCVSGGMIMQSHVFEKLMMGTSLSTDEHTWSDEYERFCKSHNVTNILAASNLVRNLFHKALY